ncbi:phosphatase PAP2 family protein [Flavobacterium sp.]|uniref:phosphatase PAP2 family protein n=1 Tax=Flavobacterium sp. TaxID=239 RepID=UPI002605E27F|nr:phosphatase PAP2 family protein [Flavobacterium sp.]
MLEELLSLDRRLFIFLNGFGSEKWDYLFLFLTNQLNWTPFFIFLFYLVFKKLGAKNTLLVMVFVAFLILITDQTTNFFKYEFKRLRPSSDPDLNTFIYFVKSKTSKTFSFFSGHAANSMAAAVFLYTILKPYYRMMWLIFIWPIVFAYTRIYLGLHYPIDILCGYLCGFLTSSLVLKGYFWSKEKHFSHF